MKFPQKQIVVLTDLVKNSRPSNFTSRHNYGGDRNRCARSGLLSTNRYCYTCGRPGYIGIDIWYKNGNQDVSQNEVPQTRIGRGRGNYRDRDRGNRQCSNHNSVPARCDSSVYILMQYSTLQVFILDSQLQMSRK